ncbi:hypothetical protein BX661DRAFT_63633 [Kickxella alabastrina]|uniref:uncharacterized protein n=1 Tax=Kickxella alabastrina TaxID=61397 RepID=UPI00221FD84E|nr:uncharacterized protein BX661DRAFT_63633 [Kickxella alabastrina]KAI7833639.1 hypothetical protein BX661DRAFT_63633 [Kickxella alabastrina]
MGNQISFTVTESELQRQKANERASTPMDPRGKIDAIMMVVFASIYSFDFLTVLFLLWNRNYPPLKSKGPIIMTLIILISMIWFVGDLQGNGHLPLANTPLTNCKAFGFWMRILMGACTICALTAFRAYGLYRVFFLNLPYHTVGLYLPFVIYYACLLIYGVVCQVLKPEITVMYLPSIDICKYTRPFKMSLFVFMWLSWVAMMGVFWKIRNIKSSFNEGREMLISCGIIFGALLSATVMNVSRPLYPLSLSLRVITTVLNHFAANALWWIIMAVPMYNCMFNRQEYLNRWILKLRKDGLQNEYDIDPNASGNHSRISSSSNNAREIILHSTIVGGGNKRGFLPMNGGSLQSKESDSRLSSQYVFLRHSESPFNGDRGIDYSQGSRSMGAM